MKKPSKKPTTKEIISRMYDIEVGINQLYNMINHVKGIFDAYLKMNGDVKKFEKYIKKIEEKQDDTTREQSGGTKDPKE